MRTRIPTPDLIQEAAATLIGMQAARVMAHHLTESFQRALGLLCLLASLGCVPLAAQADDSGDTSADTSAAAWLSRMEKALREENYEGIFTYMRGYQFDTVKVVHEFKDNKEIERLTALNGEPRELIRDGDKVVFRHAKSASDEGGFEQEMPLGPFTHAFNEKLSNYRNFYEFKVLGKDRVAGRPAVKLGISPRNNDRYGYRLWLDEKTGLLLQSHLVDRGHVLEIFQFSRVDIGKPIDPSQFSSTLDNAVERELSPIGPEGASVASIKPSWKVAWLPTGFRLVSTEAPNRLLYSDGIATFSVFVDGGNSSRLGEITTHMGGTVVITRRLKGSAQQITVVGEVPVDTARKVAESVEPANH